MSEESNTKRPTRWPLLSWFAGANPRILRWHPSDVFFYNTLGAGVVLLSCASGFAVALAAGFMLGEPVGEIWWVGAGWTLILALAVERLILQVATDRKGWLLIVLVPRVLLSVVLAAMLGEPLVMKIYEGEIEDRLSSKEVAAKQVARRDVRAAFAEPIRVENEKLTGIREQKTRVAKRISEAPSPALRASWLRRKQETRELHQENIPRIEGELRRLRRERADQTRERVEKISGGDGLAAREAALADLAGERTSIAIAIWVLRAFFLLVDLLPLGAKVLRLLTVDSPYEAAVAAARRDERLGARRLEGQARVEEERIEERARIDIEIARAEANARAARLLRELDEEVERNGGGTARAEDDPGVAAPRPGGGSVADSEPPTRPTGGPVRALSLDRMVPRMRIHESQPVAVPAGLRRAALIGVAAIGMLATALAGGPAWAGHPLSGTWLAAAALVCSLGLMAYTGGFRSAPAWALRATLAVFYVGLSLPPLIGMLNV